MVFQISELEEFDIIKEIQFPHLMKGNSLSVARSILFRKENEILLLSVYAFKDPSVLAGITEKHIEFIAKNAPKDYKEMLLRSFCDLELITEAKGIVKKLDSEMKLDSTQNQDRLNNILQYVKDNTVVFKF